MYTYWATVNGAITGMTEQLGSVYVVVESTCSIYKLDESGEANIGNWFLTSVL